MSTITVAQELETQRGTVAPYFEGLREDMAAHFWETFGAAAAAYRGARSESVAATTFAGVCRELIRDAKGTASDAKYVRGASIPDEWPVSVQPWATMPTDGSGRMGSVERVVVFAVGVLSALILVWLGLLTSGVFGSSPDAPAAAPLPMATAADVRESDTDMITRGAYWSWEAYTECGNGPAACDAVLRDVNREAHAYGLHVWEDGSVSPL